jgi:SNF2 family DNA or RNA helicase
VLTDLPSVIEISEVVDLTDAQRATYEHALRRTRKQAWNNDFLGLFNELRSICDMDPVTGSSSKLDRIVDLLEEVQANGEKAVVFSFLRAPLKELARRLSEDARIGCAVVTGELSISERESELLRFRTDVNCRVLLGSSRIAGEGLTLTNANHVMFINRWWNPTANDQARDRVVRIGQERVVEAWNFATRGTVEYSIEKILIDKKATFASLIESLRIGQVGGLESLFANVERT